MSTTMGRQTAQDRAQAPRSSTTAFEPEKIISEGGFREVELAARPRSAEFFLRSWYTYLHAPVALGQRIASVTPLSQNPQTIDAFETERR
jgi:hypothetical protein